MSRKSARPLADGQCRKGEVDCGHGKDGGGLKRKGKRHPLCQRGSGRNGAGTQLPRGSYHPLSLVLQDIRDTFLEMGFSISEGPEIELDHYNFELLNIPKDHPARDEQDTFISTTTSFFVRIQALYSTYDAEPKAAHQNDLPGSRIPQRRR